MSNGRTLRGIWLGRRPYQAVYALQRTLQSERQENRIVDVVLFLEHPPVVTLGRGAHAQNLLVSEAALTDRGVELARPDRGGDVTLHAPGQLVGYPILDLRPDRCDVRRYVGDLAEAMRRLVGAHGIASGPVSSLVGLWVDVSAPDTWNGLEGARRPAKIGAIGVRISRWVTMHGFALNLSTDLALFDLIVPCGISQFGVASVASLTGSSPTVRDEAQRALVELGSVFDARALAMEDRSAGDLDAAHW
jgi:lipoyl(octanoyl) transferase